MERLGNRTPAELVNVDPETVELFTADSTGMEYAYHHGLGLLEACHEDVGLVTYFRLTPADWDAIIDAEADALTEPGCFACGEPVQFCPGHGDRWQGEFISHQIALGNLSPAARGMAWTDVADQWEAYTGEQLPLDD